MNLDHLYFPVREIPIHVFCQFFFLIFPLLESQQFLRGIVIFAHLKLLKSSFNCVCPSELAWSVGWWGGGRIHPPYFDMGGVSILLPWGKLGTRHPEADGREDPTPDTQCCPSRVAKFTLPQQPSTPCC